MASPPSPAKKGMFILFAVVLAPVLLVGLMTTADPTRSPAGTEAVWAYTHVPQQVNSDAGGSITGAWDSDDLNRMADRMQDRIERNAPGFSSRILARRILGPREMESRNANLVGGALGGGTAALHQELIFRPVTGLGRAETPVKGLYLGSASAHPGGGAHGACGANAARAALWHERLRPERVWRETLQPGLAGWRATADLCVLRFGIRLKRVWHQPRPS